ncbi:MAG TPA: hypothetical protein P5229_05570, partial [Candidatus Gracilibacteria bacterium]|nr:hypothetical protein [Candidatus Gracilibacteria bacterium]
MRTKLKPTIDLLQQIGLVELEDTALQSEYALNPYMLGEADEKHKTELETLLLSVDGLLDRFQRTRDKQEVMSPAEKFTDTALMQTQVDMVNSQVQKLLGERAANRDALTLLSQYREMVKALSRQLPPTASDPGKRVFAGLIRANSSHNLTDLESQLKELSHNKQIVTKRVSIKSGLTAFVIIYPQDRQMQMEEILQANSPFEISLPDEFSPRQPEEAKQQIN